MESMPLSNTPKVDVKRYSRRVLAAEIHVDTDGNDVTLSKSILLQVRPWNETEYGTEVLTGRRLAMCSFLQGEWTPGKAHNKIMLRPNDMDGIEKKIEGVMNGSQTFAIIRNGEDGRVPIFLSYKDDGKTILVITMGGPITGYQDSLAEIQFRGRQLVEFPAAIAWMKSRIAEENHETAPVMDVGASFTTPIPVPVAGKSKRRSASQRGKNIATDQMRAVMERKMKSEVGGYGMGKKPQVNLPKIQIHNTAAAGGEGLHTSTSGYDPLLEFFDEDIINEIARGGPPV